MLCSINWQAYYTMLSAAVIWVILTLKTEHTRSHSHTTPTLTHIHTHTPIRTHPYTHTIHTPSSPHTTHNFQSFNHMNRTFVNVIKLFSSSQMLFHLSLIFAGKGSLLKWIRICYEFFLSLWNALAYQCSRQINKNVCLWEAFSNKSNIYD
jgi:hypothetical protein